MAYDRDQIRAMLLRTRGGTSAAMLRMARGLANGVAGPHSQRDLEAQILRDALDIYASGEIEGLDSGFVAPAQARLAELEREGAPKPMSERSKYRARPV